MVTPRRTAPKLIEIADILPLSKYRKASAVSTPKREGTKAIRGTEILL